MNALATFIVLSYVKILNVSFQYFVSSLIYDTKGHIVKKVYWYYDGRVDMTSREYLPYLVLAIFMSLIFNVIPLLLLALYPFRFFQKFLNCCPCLNFKLALQLIMDAFLGCYKDSKHDCRHFAALYLALRFFKLLLLSVLRNKIAVYSVTTLLFVLALTLVAYFRPYKCKKRNIIDIVMLLTLVIGSVLLTIESTIGLKYHKLFDIIGFAAVASIPFISMLLLALTHIKTKALQCFRRSKVFLLERMNQILKEDESEDRPALLNPSASGYNTLP